MNTGLYDERPARRIDYERMNREYPKVKAGLTRARNGGNPLRVRAAVARFIALSDACGAMPDDWALFRNALEDAFEDWRRSAAGEEDIYYGGGGELARWREVGRGFNF